jgi:pimeloyl-ACP methyl ester carboxylesterase
VARAMQPVSFENSRNLRLAGSLYPADSKTGAASAIVIMAHGFTGDRDSKGRFPRVAQALNAVGICALTFDFSGCGESADDTLSVAKQVDDLRAAVEFVRGLGYARLALWGHSLGSRICLEVNPPGVATMVLTGAATGPVEYDWAKYYSPAQLAELAKTGRLTVALPERALSEVLRSTVVVEAQMLREIAEVDQAGLLRGIECPVLIVHGDADDEERRLSAISRCGLNHLPAGSRLEVIPGADHSMLTHFDRVIELGAAWLRERLAVPPAIGPAAKRPDAVRRRID